MKRAQKNFERDPRKIFFCERNPTAMRKQKITNKVRDLIICTAPVKFDGIWF